jgi:hypothetical protein
MRRTRPTSLFAHALGIVLMIPGLLQVPLPQADFHVVRHHHGAGELCPKHDHLLRWHPQASEGEDVAVLHWHWLLPRSSDLTPPEIAGRSIPAVHAHDGDPNHLDPTSGPIVVQDVPDLGSRGAIASAQGLSPALASWLVPPPPAPPDLGPARRAASDGFPADFALARLVRWNC